MKMDKNFQKGNEKNQDSYSRKKLTKKTTIIDSPGEMALAPEKPSFNGGTGRTLWEPRGGE